MIKSDIKEIRKALKGKAPAIGWVYGMYVDASNEVQAIKEQSFASMPEEDMMRHVDIFQKAISMRMGRDSFSIPVKKEPEMLMGIRNSDGKEEALAPFCNVLLNGYMHDSPYYAVVAQVVYDVPVKASDGVVLEDSDNTYTALLCAICPASLSKPVLGPDNGNVSQLVRRWQIGNPEVAFLYPAFTDRTEDRYEFLLHSKTPEEESFVLSLFGTTDVDVPVGEGQQKEALCGLLEKMGAGVESVSGVAQSLKEESSHATSLDKLTLRRMFVDNGVNVKSFDDAYAEEVGEKELSLDAVALNSVTIRTDSATVTIPAERASILEAKEVDGRMFILVPADGVVTVNGTEITM